MASKISKRSGDLALFASGFIGLSMRQGYYHFVLDGDQLVAHMAPGISQTYPIGNLGAAVREGLAVCLMLAAAGRVLGITKVK